MNHFLGTLPPGSAHYLDVPYVEGAKPGFSYCSVQTLDLFVPAGPGPFPLLISFHGGGWHAGSKETGGISLARRRCRRGSPWRGVDYRFIQDAPFRRRSTTATPPSSSCGTTPPNTTWTPDHVGVIGHSAGAHLAALMAATGDGTTFSNGPVSVRVQAAVCWSGPFDMDRERGNWPKEMFMWNAKDPVNKWFFPGGAYDADLARKASPASYVHAGMPPMLILHGDSDKTVPLGQAQAFADALKAAGVDVTFHIAPRQGPQRRGAPPTPTRRSPSSPRTLQGK